MLRTKRINRGADQPGHKSRDKLLYSDSVCFAALCMDEAERIIQEGCVVKSRNFLQCGVPHCEHRLPLWRLALGLISSTKIGASHKSTSPEHIQFSKLCAQVDESELSFVDNAVCGEVDRMTDDDEYFIFAEQMRLALLCFMRDEQVYDTCKQLHNTPHPILTMKTNKVVRGSKSQSSMLLKMYPPSGEKSVYCRNY